MGNFTLFTDNTFMESKIGLDIRKEQKLKYCEVTLPKVTDKKHSFHTGCYRQFIALPKSQRENYKDQLEKLHQPRKEKSNVVSTISSFSPKSIEVSSTGVSQKKCIFCLQTVKKHNNIKQSLI